MESIERIDIMKTGKKKLREQFLFYILQWDPKWFTSENTSPKQLDSITPLKLKPSQLIYNNYDDYSQTQLLSLIYDLWYELEDVRTYCRDKYEQATISLTKTSLPLICIPVNLAGNKVCRIKMRKELGRFNPKSFYPNRGSLAKFKNSLNGNLEEFAFIDDVQRDNLRGSHKFKLTYNLTVKYQENMEFPHMINLETVSVPVSVYLNFVDSLIQLSESPLCQPILKPNFEDYNFSSIDCNNEIKPVFEDKLNPKQLNIMARVVKTVEEKKPGIFMVSGPPGTGKTKIVIHSILSIISRKKSDKILVFGQSNLAIDSIVLKLLSIKPKLEEKGIPLNIVRIGREEKMNEQVQAVSFETLKQRRGNNGYELLRKADVIGGTIASYNSYMKQFFKGLEIPVCIIDDAPQASELETCVPLVLGVKTMILVGDSCQFSPKTYSEEVKKQNLGQSLFLRAEKIFEKDENNPILTLDTQYRMNEAISKWPNKYFYNGALKNSASNRPLGFYNYRVFNHSYEDEDDGWLNVGKAKLAINIVYTLMTQVNIEVLKEPIHLGIIVLSDHQHKYMIKMLDQSYFTSDICKERRDKFQLKVVKTSEAFQGSECDVIILSCVRTSDHKFIDDPNRLCVSLTRAKHTLIICGNFDKYKENEMWKDLIENSQERNALVEKIDDHNNEPSFLKKYLINNE